MRIHEKRMYFTHHLRILLILLLSNIVIGVSLGESVNSVTVNPDPFGPLPASVNITIDFTAVDDYVNIIYDQDGNIVRRLQNRTAPSDPLTDTWDGQNDAAVNLQSGTYDIDVKVTRTVTYDAKIPGTQNFVDFDEPIDIACDKNGNVYVLDRGLHIVEKFSPNGTLLNKFSFSIGTGNGAISNEFGITVDTNNYFYISDQGATRGRVQKFNSSGTYISSFTAPDTGDSNFTGLGYNSANNEIFTASLSSDDVMRINNGTMALGNQNTQPADWNIRDIAIATDDGDIFGVHNGTIRRITRTQFTANNAWNNSWASGLTDLYGITLRSNNYIYVVARGSDQIGQFNIGTGGSIETFGSSGTASNEFNNPQGIAWDPANDFIWVADTGNKRLVKLYDDPSTGIEWVNTIEPDPSGLINPLDIALDKNGNVYIVDNGHACVKKFDQYGNFLFQIGQPGSTPTNGDLYDPQGVTVDNDGYIYISDYGTSENDDAQDQIMKYDSSGNYLTNWNHPDGRGLDSFLRNGTNYIVGIAESDGATLDNTTSVYLQNGTRVQWFNSIYDDVNYGDVVRDYSGRFYMINATGTAWLESYPDNAQGSNTVPDFDDVSGTRGGIAVDDYGSLWITEKDNDDIEVRQNDVLGDPDTQVADFLGAGTGDGQLNDPTYCTIRVLDNPGEWAHLWICDSKNNRVQKFIVNWDDSKRKQVTIANTGLPKVTAAFPETSNTNVNRYAGTYYARAGSGTTIRIVFSQAMDTNTSPIVRLYTEDSAQYPITQTYFSNNIWIGTCSIPTGHDGTASLYVSGAKNTSGSNISPDPDTSKTFIIDTTPPTITINQPSSPTSFTNISVSGTSEPGISVAIYNYTASNGSTINSSNTGIHVSGSGDFSARIDLITPKESTNWITGYACDYAGNKSTLYSPWRKVRAVNLGGGSGYILPTTNKKLGDYGDPNLTLMWTADSDMVNGTYIIDLPKGWAAPSLTSGNSGYVYISDSSGITFASSPTNLQVRSNRIKVCFSAASVGSYVELTYGTNNRTMVSNTARLGQNKFQYTAENNNAGYKTNWNLPRIVYPPPGKSQIITVLGITPQVYYTSSMPSAAYKGQSSITVMTLFITNANTSVNDLLKRIVLTTEDTNNASIIPNTAVSRVQLFTNGQIYYNDPTIETSGDTITLNLGTDPLIINSSTCRTLVIKIDINATATADTLRFNVKNNTDITITDETTDTSYLVEAYSGYSFPMRSSNCSISSGQPATQVYTSYNGLGNQAFDIGESDGNTIQVICSSTSNGVNEIQITGMEIRIEDSANSGVVPNSVISKITVRDAVSGFTYLQDSTIESSGSYIFLDLYASSIFISPQSSITLNILCDISSTTATNIHTGIISATNITARDKVLLNTVTNNAYSGFSFPMRGNIIQLIAGYTIGHDTAALVNIWENVAFRATNAAGNDVTYTTKTINIDTDGTASTIGWQNQNGNGAFTDNGAGVDTASYTFVAADNGSIILQISNATAETISVDVADLVLNASSNNLTFIAADPDIIVTKTQFVTNDSSYTGLGGGIHEMIPGAEITYCITISNQGAGPATNITISDPIPAKTAYASGHLMLDGVSLTEGIAGDDEGDYNITESGAVHIKIDSLPAKGVRRVVFKVILK